MIPIRLGRFPFVASVALLLCLALGALPGAAQEGGQAEIADFVGEYVGEAEVVSATPLSPAQVTQITTVLEQLSGKKVTVVKREDPALLGGVVAKVGDLVYDGSLRSQLRALRDDMAK